MRYNALCSVAVLSVIAAHSAAADWPQWRGPDRNGISNETDWNSDWSRKPPGEIWRGHVGLGFSSVAVADGRLYTLGHGGGNETVFCLNAVTGEPIWKKSYPCEVIARYYEGGSSSTPTVHGGRVYSLGKEGRFFCFNATTGDVQWEHDLREKLGSKTPEWGFACSPLVLGDHVIVQAGVVAAFDRKTGEEVWRSQRFQQGYGSPMPFDYKGKTLLAVLNSHGLIVVDASDGKVLADTRWKTQFDTNSTTPIIVDDAIFISTGYRKGCALFRFTGGAFEQIYSNQNMANHMNNCVLIGGHLYGFDGNSHRSQDVTLNCMDFRTGAVRWRQEGLGCGALMATKDGRLICNSDRGDLVIAAASPDGYKEIARQDRVVRGKVWTTPVLANGRIYCRSTPGDLVCLDVSK